MLKNKRFKSVNPRGMMIVKIAPIANL